MVISNDDSADTDLPSVISLGSTPVPLGTRVAGMDLSGARGVDAFGLSAPVFIPSFEPASAGSAVQELADKLVDAETTTRTERQRPSTWDVSLEASTGILIGDLEILGARLYDPGTRGFLTPDPVASPVGAGWSANVYAFAGFDPVSLVDPWGTSPMSAAQFGEYRADTAGRARDRVWAGTKNVVGAGVDWVQDNWQGIAMVAAGVAATAFLGPFGAAIVGGALISGGFSAFANKNPDGSIKWGSVAKDALFGAASGGAGLKIMGFTGKVLAPQFSKVATAAGAKAEGFFAKSVSHSSTAENLGWWRPASKGFHNWRAGVNNSKFVKFDAKATKWSNLATPKGFSSSVLGKVVEGSSAGTTSNAMSYTMPNMNGNNGWDWSIRENFSASGFAKATAGGSTLGAVKPMLPKANNSLVNYGFERGKDYISGIGNYAATTERDQWRWEKANYKGLTAVEKVPLKVSANLGIHIFKSQKKFKMFQRRSN